MLKIYRAYDLQGKVVLDDYIEFKYGIFSTGANGFGDIVISKDMDKASKKFNYENTSSKNYVELTKKFAELQDGFITKSPFFNLYSYEDLKEKYKNISKTESDYEKYRLNEDGILLFTDYINLKYKNEGLIEKIFGRYPGTAMYLVKPGATMTLQTSISPKIEETYEVLQSKNLGKQLILTKLNRPIK